MHCCPRLDGVVWLHILRMRKSPPTLLWGVPMRISFCLGAIFICVCCFSLACFGQQAAPAGANQLSLNVVITDKSGKPVGGLETKDLQVLNNKQPQKILSLQPMKDGELTEIVLVLDEVNTPYSDVGIEREGISKFLRANGGKLPYPVTIAYFSNRGTTLLGKGSTDGNGLAAAYEAHETAVRSFNQLATSYGALEQFQLSFKTLTDLVNREGQEPGRKMIVWFSRGWPIMAVDSVDLDKKEEDALFAAIISTSRAMQEGRVTLYNINSAGQANRGATMDYLSFMKPVQEAKHAEVGNLALQVLATQSGGLVLHSSNDLASEIDRCIADVGASYTLTIQTASSDHANQYHAIQIKPQIPGVTVRTISGYYEQP